MSELKDLKRKHKRLETLTKKATKKRLSDRTSESWKNLRELKKLKLKWFVFFSRKMKNRKFSMENHIMFH